MNPIVKEDVQILLKKNIAWEEFRDTHILVTGGTGLVGSLFIKMVYAISKTLQLDIRISAQVRNISKAKQIFHEEDIEYVVGDFTEDPELLQRISSVDYIIHTAAITESIEMIEHPVENIMTSILGTRQVLELAKEHQVRKCIYLSSMEIYGEVTLATDRQGEDELGDVDITVPRSCYPEGKRMCECLAIAYHSEYGVPVCSARLAQTFGAGVSQEDSRVFAQFARCAKYAKNIQLHTQGTSYGNYCYTMDVVYGLLLLLQRGESGQSYNIVNEETTMTIRDMAQMVCDTIADGTISVVIPEGGTSENSYGYAKETGLRLSSNKIETLGWEPTFSLDQMYTRMLRSWEG